MTKRPLRHRSCDGKVSNVDEQMGVATAKSSLSNQRKGVVGQFTETQRLSLARKCLGKVQTVAQWHSMEKQGNGIVLRSMAKALLGESKKRNGKAKSFMA